MAELNKDTAQMGGRAMVAGLTFFDPFKREIYEQDTKTKT